MERIWLTQVKHDQGKGKQARIEKKNSLSSIESDSRSSNFVFVQGPYATSNGIQSDRPIHCDKENEDELQGSQRQVMNGLPGGYGREKEGAHEKREKLVSSSDQDPLVESTSVLKNAQESLEKGWSMFLTLLLIFFMNSHNNLASQQVLQGFHKLTLVGLSCKDH